MLSAELFTDIHCHLLPGIDDGARSWDESLEMAQIAAANGTGAIIATPHQGGAFAHNTCDLIIRSVEEFRSQLQTAGVPLTILPGADVRYDTDLLKQLAKGNILTLGNHRRHLLLDLPHERYVPFENLLAGADGAGIALVLSHPERNQGLLKRRRLVEELVDRGCLMQVTSGSLLGTFGPTCQELAVWMLSRGLVHFVATDAHGMHSRRPLMRRVYERLVELVGRDEATELCCRNPRRVAEGQPVTPGRRQVRMHQSRWFRWKAA